jgi:hypothetical protein
VLTVTGASPFLATDLHYHVGILMRDRGYDSSSDSWRSNIVAVMPGAYNTLFTLFAGAIVDGTYQYYVQMDNNHKVSLQYDFWPVNAFTITLWGTNANTAAPAVMWANGEFMDITNTLFSNPTITSPGYFIDNTEKTATLNYLTVQVVVNTGGANIGALKIYGKKMI